MHNEYRTHTHARTHSHTHTRKHTHTHTHTHTLIHTLHPLPLSLCVYTDCPQVQAIYDYKAAQPDELSLERGDVVKVYRKMADGEQTVPFHVVVVYAHMYIILRTSGKIQLNEW